MPIEVRSYDDSLWPDVQAFLHEHWQANHPLCHKPLFDWQYRGFGPRAGSGACRVAVDGGRILGFLGAIPGQYRLDGRLHPGVALALWVVVPQMRNSGLGMLLMREVERQADVVACLGIGPAVTRYYVATGYQFLSALHRYVVPLEAEGYARLLPNAQPATIARWLDEASLQRYEAFQPRPVDPAELAAAWTAGAGDWRLALERTQDFWDWRYRQAVGFEYASFGDAGRGCVIARLDRIAAPDRPDIHGRPVLRIIEIIAGRSAPHADRLTNVLGGVLRWAREHRAIAADFQCSSTRLAEPLLAVGMRPRSQDVFHTLLPELFNPLRPDVAPINLAVKVSANASGRAPDRHAEQGCRSPLPAPAFDETYFVKSDGDMDRPPRWPLDPSV